MLKDFSFRLRPNVHMYCHELICASGGKEYRCIVESSPNHADTIVFWAEQLGVPTAQRDQLLQALKSWASQQSFSYCIYWENELWAMG
jgi:hypothetical protein